LHCCGVSSGKGFAAHLLDLLLQFGHGRSCHRAFLLETRKE